MNRREFIKLSAAASAGALVAGSAIAQETSQGRPQPKIPRWRGFNLTEMAGGRQVHPYRESDFETMAQWGFNFARLPLSYWGWCNPKNWLTINPEGLAPLDQAAQ